jgi:hypothetical protein
VIAQAIVFHELLHAKAKRLTLAGEMSECEQRELEALLPGVVACDGCDALMAESAARYMQEDGLPDVPVCSECAAEYRNMGRIVR